MNKRTELLAPAGDWDSFAAAIENGADAVYLGGKLFNARQFAGNFDNEQLKRAIDYAHVRDARVYLTMNTLISDSELKQAVHFTEEAYIMGIDGIIVQDIGFAGLVRNIFPDLDLHASTQMTIYNLEGVKLLEQLGFKRVVLARELSIEEISHIAKNTQLEIEVFVHGALCISYSGQCLMSSMIGGRSGNRGKCAQPCRLPYELVEASSGKKAAFHSKGYLLSPKDLSSIEQLAGIVDAGVRSLKIEGRMKSAEYVATVVRIYRKYLDGIEASQHVHDECIKHVSREDLRDLAQIFNRGGFSTGYLRGKNGKDMISCEKPKNWGIYLGEVLSFDRNSRLCRIKLSEDLSIGDGIEVWNNEEGESPGTVVSEIIVDGRNVSSAKKGQIAMIGRLKGNIFKGNRVYKTSDKKLLDKAKETYAGKGIRRTALRGRVCIHAGKPVEFYVADMDGNEVAALGEALPEPAINRPLEKERVVEQLCKTGGTPFEFAAIDVNLDEGLSIPVSELNNVRRRALNGMEKKKISLFERTMSKESIEKKEKLICFSGNRRKSTRDMKVSVLFYSVYDSINYSKLSADRVYLPFKGFLNEGAIETTRILKAGGIEVFVWLPSVTRGNYDHLIESRLEDVVKAGIDGILAGNPGSIGYVRRFPGIKACGDYSLNSFNSFTLEELSGLGISGATLSLELSMDQIGSLREISGLDKEAVVYGKIPLMTSEYCPVGSLAGGHSGSRECSGACALGEYRLKDRKGMEFPVLCDCIDCRSIILNPNALFIPDSLDRIKDSGVDMVRINITDEKPDEVYEILNLHRDIIREGQSAMDRYGDLIASIKAKGFTKGHYYRGV